MTFNNIMIIVFIVFMIIFFVNVININMRIFVLNKKISKFFKTEGTTNFETLLIEHFDEIKQLKDIVNKQNDKLKKIKQFVDRSYQNVSILRYNAYEESGEKLSFVICMLNNKNDGILLNNIYTYNGSCLYVKEIIGGTSSIKLTIEEEETLFRTIARE